MSELEKVLAEAIKNAGGKIGSGIDFVSGNMPELIQQTMWWYGVSSFFWMMVGVFGMVMCFRIYEKLRSDPDDDEHDKDIVLFKRIGICFLCGFYFCLFAFNTDWLKIMISPKLWLVEFSVGLLK